MYTIFHKPLLRRAFFRENFYSGVCSWKVGTSFCGKMVIEVRIFCVFPHYRNGKFHIFHKNSFVMVSLRFE